MKKKWLNALEKIWEAEIENRLPYQSSAGIYSELETVGLVEPMRRMFGNCAVYGWQLTHLGRMDYCRYCADTVSE